MANYLKFVVNKRGPRLLFPWNYIGQGGEAKVYRKKNLAYKYYRILNFDERLSWDDVQLLKEISTKRILLPQDTLYTVFGKFKGYTTQYVQDLGLVHFMQLPTKVILDEFNLLQEDNRTLSEKKIVISDLMSRDYRVCNYSFNQGVYFVDPGKFYQDERLTAEEVRFINQCEMDDFLYFRVFSRYANEEIGKDIYNYDNLWQLKKDAKDVGESFMDFISRDIKENNLESYIKRKIL